MPHASPSQEMARCIDSCQECARTCLETARHCLEMGGEHAAAEHITTLLDCAEICRTSANFMARGSDMHGAICGVCADACIRCAEACERFPDDEVMRKCAEICRRCAESCQRMAGVAA
jgi:hypothetical protein